MVVLEEARFCPIVYESCTGLMSCDSRGIMTPRKAHMICLGVSSPPTLWSSSWSSEIRTMPWRPCNITQARSCLTKAFASATVWIESAGLCEALGPELLGIISDRRSEQTGQKLRVNACSSVFLLNYTELYRQCLLSTN